MPALYCMNVNSVKSEWLKLHNLLTTNNIAEFWKLDKQSKINRLNI